VNGPSGLWSIGLSAVGTIFDGGRRRSLNDQARAAYDYQSLPIARTCWLDSNKLKTTWPPSEFSKMRRRFRMKPWQQRKRSLELSTIRYRGEVTSYLEVITAQSAALADEVTAVNILGRPYGEHCVC